MSDSKYRTDLMRPIVPVEEFNKLEKAVLLKLKDGREEWFPWSGIESMEWAKP